MESKKSSLATCFHPDNIHEIGVDEAGRGPLLGRVYAAAVVLPKGELEFSHELMKDSKKFTSTKKMNEASDLIKKEALAWAVAWRSEATVDAINIRNATFETMHDCITQVLPAVCPDNLDSARLLVDGDSFKPYIRFSGATNLHSTIPHVCVKHGDNTYSSIAAASILAKTARDSYIDDLCEQFPDLDRIYSIRSNKGYGSKTHIDAIRTHGITPWHRRTYGLCKTSHHNLDIKPGPSQLEP